MLLWRFRQRVKCYSTFYILILRNYFYITIKTILTARSFQIVTQKWHHPQIISLLEWGKKADASKNAACMAPGRKLISYWLKIAFFLQIKELIANFLSFYQSCDYIVRRTE